MKGTTILALGVGLSLAGCATKGARTVSAPAYTPSAVASPVEWAVKAAPRTEPGKIMDPEAVTFAQVPSRIIYLPGKGGIFSRESARQEVAYNLIPVDRIRAVQAESTPEFQEKTAVVETGTKRPNVFPTIFPDEKGNSVKGQARRLGVVGKTEVEKVRAGSLLQKGEILKWTPDVGWVGFTEEIVVRPPVEKKQTIEILPEAEEKPMPKLPAISTPDVGEIDLDKKTKEKDSEKKTSEPQLSFDE